MDSPNSLERPEREDTRKYIPATVQANQRHDSKMILAQLWHNVGTLF